ncbi:MAG: hypothetical protein V3S91_06280 [Gemmatimonadota bacterium]
MYAELFLAALLASTGPLWPPIMAGPSGGSAAESPDGSDVRPSDARPSDEPYLYRILLVRAAPGRLLDLIERFQLRMAAYEAAGEGRPHLMRHSQGDQWDLMLIFPMGDFERFYAPARTERRNEALEGAGGVGREWRDRLDPLVAWREDLFVWGPPPDRLDARFDGMRFYHVEMFVALPGRRGDLLRQREMENDYLKRTDRPLNLIFTREGGASWDVVTLGFYRDLQHFAQRSDLTPEQADEAARAAGFEASNRLGTYLRTLIDYHHDTLAVAVE